MTDKIQELKQAVYTKLRDLMRKTAASSGNNAGGRGNHGGSGQGVNLGVGHSEHGQGYGYGHTETGVGDVMPVQVDPPSSQGGAGHIGDYLDPMISGPSGLGDITRREVPTLDVAIRAPKNKEKILPSVVLQISENYPNIDPNLISMLVEDIWAYGYVSQDDNDGRVLSVDFDGTIAEWAEFPRTGRPIPGAIAALRKLISEGWKVIVFSHRATFPGGREQIAVWLAAQGLEVGAIIPKVYARWYVDDRAIEFRNNWDNIYTKLHYDIPVEIAGPEINFVDIIAGKHSLRTIAEKLGYDPAEMHADLASAYGSHTEEEAAVVESKLRNRYGLDISLRAMMAEKDANAYVLRKLAGLVEKLTTNHIEEGDPVVVVKEGSTFGDSGVVLNISEDKGATVALDGVPCKTEAFAKYTEELVLAAGATRLDPLKKDASQAASASWYSVSAPHIASHAEGLPVRLTYAGPAGTTLVKDSAAFVVDKVNANRLLTVDTDLTAATRLAALHINPNKGISSDYTKVVVADLVDNFLGYPGLADVSLRFSGTNGYYMTLKFDRDMEPSRLKSALTNSIKAYAEDTGMVNVTTEYTVCDSVLMVTPCVATVPAAYSLHKDSGLVCVPLDLTSLITFTPECATVAALTGGAGTSTDAQEDASTH